MGGGKHKEETKERKECPKITKLRLTKKFIRELQDEKDTHRHLIIIIEDCTLTQIVADEQKPVK